MSPPRADPTGLVLRWIEELSGHRVLLVDPPTAIEGIRLLDGLRSAGAEGHVLSHRWPLHQALQVAGVESHFGEWPLQGPVDGALLFLPKARERTRMLVDFLLSLLPPGAPLWIVGAKRDGIEGAARELGEDLLLDRSEPGKHARLLIGRTPAPRRGRPFTLEGYLQEWRVALPGVETQEVGVLSLPGVFSHGRLDEGTRLLLEQLPAPLPSPVLDVGCGAGVIGLAALLRGAAEVIALDEDALAVEATRRTFALHGAAGQSEAGEREAAGHGGGTGLGFGLALAGDLFPPVGRFRTILTNPPFHQGTATDHRMTERLIAEAPGRLLPGGTLTLVANHFLPLLRPLKHAFGEVEILAEDGRYRVYRARR